MSTLTILHVAKGDLQEGVIILDNETIQDVTGNSDASHDELAEGFAGGGWQIEGIWEVAIEKEGSALPIGELLERV